MAEFTGTSDLDIVSVEPCEPVPGEWDWDTGHLYTYRVTPSSMVTFLSQQYRSVAWSAHSLDRRHSGVLLRQ